MRTFEEIEAAVKSLPQLQQAELFRQLSARLAEGPSCYDLVRDLFEEPGRLDNSGLSDHSTNKKYLEDLGRSSVGGPR
jgi:hypothetical protein